MPALVDCLQVHTVLSVSCLIVLQGQRGVLQKPRMGMRAMRRRSSGCRMALQISAMQKRWTQRCGMAA